MKADSQWVSGIDDLVDVNPGTTSGSCAGIDCDGRAVHATVYVAAGVKTVEIAEKKLGHLGRVFDIDAFGLAEHL